jgi:hypothetical protein
MSSKEVLRAGLLKARAGPDASRMRKERGRYG